MLDHEQGSVDFTSELLDLIDSFLTQYEGTRNGPLGELERGLVICYVLGVMRCDLEAIWDSLGDAVVFGALRPQAVFEECDCSERRVTLSRREAIVEALESRRWLRFEESGK